VLPQTRVENILMGTPSKFVEPPRTPALNGEPSRESRSLTRLLVPTPTAGSGPERPAVGEKCSEFVFVCWRISDRFPSSQWTVHLLNHNETPPFQAYSPFATADIPVQSMEHSLVPYFRLPSAEPSATLKIVRPFSSIKYRVDAIQQDKCHLLHRGTGIRLCRSRIALDFSPAKRRVPAHRTGNQTQL